MNKKRVAVLYSGAKSFGGIETYILNLFNNYDKKKVDIRLLSLGEWELTRRLKKDEVTIFPTARLRPQTALEISRYLQCEDFNLIVTHGNVSTAYGRLASLLSGIPNITTIHSDPYFDYHSPLLRFIYRSLDRLSSFQTKRYIAVSNYLKKIVSAQGINSREVRVIYNGTRIPSVRLKEKSKKVVIGSAGRLNPVKNFHQLIRAMALIQNENVELQIAGEGEERDHLELLIGKLGLRDRVKLVGFQEDIYQFLRKLDMYIQPSEAEGFGLLVVEAMGVGLPAVVSPKGSLPEIVKDGENGIIAKGTSPEAIAAAISLLLDNEKLRIDLSKNAKKSVEKEFSIGKWIEETIENYLEVSK